MKKLLGIIVLGLLLSGNSHAVVKNDLNSMLEILSQYPDKSKFALCEGGEADMGIDLNRWSKWDNCIGTLKFTDESGENLTFISQFKNGKLIGKFSLDQDNLTIYGTMKETGCKKNGYLISDGILKKVKLDKECNVKKIINID
jgi:hypothetical protein